MFLIGAKLALRAYFSTFLGEIRESKKQLPKRSVRSVEEWHAIYRWATAMCW